MLQIFRTKNRDLNALVGDLQMSHIMSFIIHVLLLSFCSRVTVEVPCQSRIVHLSIPLLESQAGEKDAPW
jgi:hypothetical protein